MQVGVEEKKLKKRNGFFIVVIYELISCDGTIFEVFYNLENGAGNPLYQAYVIGLSVIVFFFLWLIGHEAFEFLKSMKNIAE